MSGLEYVDTYPEARPLCPRSNTVSAASEHRVALDIVNAIFAKLQPADPDTEMSAEHQAIYAAAREAAPERMRLYRLSISPAFGGRGSSYLPNGWVEAWFLRCPTCGHTIDAVARQLPAP